MRVETDTGREAVCLRRFDSRHAAAVRSWHKPDLRRTAAVRPKPDPWYAQKSTKSDPELPFSLRRSLTGLARPRPLPQQTQALRLAATPSLNRRLVLRQHAMGLRRLQKFKLNRHCPR